MESNYTSPQTLRHSAYASPEDSRKSARSISVSTRRSETFEDTTLFLLEQVDLMKTSMASGLESWHEQYSSLFKKLQQRSDATIQLLKSKITELEDDLLQKSTADYNTEWCQREITFRLKVFDQNVHALLHAARSIATTENQGEGDDQITNLKFLDERLIDLQKMCSDHASCLANVSLKLLDANKRQKTLLQRELIKKDAEVKTLYMEVEYLKSRLQQEEHRSALCEKALSSGRDTKSRRKSIFQDDSKTDVAEELQYFKEKCQQEICLRVEYETKFQELRTYIDSKFQEKPLMTQDEAIRTMRVFFRTYFYQKRWKNLVELFVKSPHSKDLRHRNHVVREIVSTEKSYVEYLDSLIKNVYVPMQKSGILKTEELHEIFSNLPTILEIHRGMSKKMESMLRNWPTHPLRMGECFLEMAPFLAVYTQYINNHNRSTKAIEYLLHKNPAFAEAVRKMESDPSLLRQGLESILIMPIQRIPRYILLLEQLLKHTPSTHLEHTKLQEASLMCKSLGEKINESKREREMQDRLKEAQRLLGQDVKIMIPGRQCFHAGNLKILDKEISDVRCYLFNDCFVALNLVEKEKYRLRGCLMLSSLSASSVKDNYPLATNKLDKIFEVLWGRETTFQDRGLFMSETIEDRNIWIAEISKAKALLQSQPLAFTPLHPLDRNRSPFVELEMEQVSTSLFSSIRRKSTISAVMPSPQKDAVVIENYDFLTCTAGMGPQLVQSVGMQNSHPTGLICGHMHKQGSIRSNSWKKRWFMLDEHNMHYYKNQPTTKDAKPAVSIMLHKITLAAAQEDSDKFFNFYIRHRDFESLVACDTWNEMRAWVLFIQEGYSGVIQGVKRRLTSSKALRILEVDESIKATEMQKGPSAREELFVTISQSVTIDQSASLFESVAYPYDPENTAIEEVVPQIESGSSKSEGKTLPSSDSKDASWFVQDSAAHQGISEVVSLSPFGDPLQAIRFDEPSIDFTEQSQESADSSANVPAPSPTQDSDAWDFMTPK
eukprot:TRINITY_DN351_c0_g1_i3.p1 TRINITY_DN351_c0_g1~~TRINITY_DN351_c0_g1_i3.p1  ORF type:complete len:1004 (-),score=180.23 TRINITY_DN351_c0_g1_i3:528-3539(-)